MLLFPVRTRETRLGSGLLRGARGGLCWIVPGAFVAAGFVVFVGRLFRFRGSERLGCLGAVEASELAVLDTFGRLGALLLSEAAVSAISSPKRAATSVSLSTFAALGAAFDSERSCPAPASVPASTPVR